MNQFPPLLLIFCLVGHSLAKEKNHKLEPTSLRLREIVKARFSNKPFYIGATSADPEWGTPEEEILNREFSYITPNNDFKQTQVHPTPEKWDWRIADEWVVRAEKHDQVLRMHAPISPQCSKWAKNDERTPAELQQNLTEYMTRICKRYNGKPAVKWLDVVNETIDKDGSWLGPKPGVNKWENPWLKIGIETNISSTYPILHQDGVPLYIIQAFEIANQHGSDLKLIINQHTLIEFRAAEKLKELALYLRERGLRVDGIGWQAHLHHDRWREWANTDSPNLDQLRKTIDWAHENNLEFHITENNIHTYTSDPYEAKLVAEAYANIIGVLVEKSDTGVIAWNLWNITDRKHWRNPNLKMYGLWDESYQPRPAYYAIQKVLESAL